jgi:hypothetical protein
MLWRGSSSSWLPVVASASFLIQSQTSHMTM